MESGIKALFLVIGLSSAPWTFAEETLSSPELGTLPEEVIITGVSRILAGGWAGSTAAKPILQVT